MSHPSEVTCPTGSSFQRALLHTCRSLASESVLYFSPTVTRFVFFFADASFGCATSPGVGPLAFGFFSLILGGISSSKIPLFRTFTLIDPFILVGMESVPL